MPHLHHTPTTTNNPGRDTAKPAVSRKHKKSYRENLHRRCARARSWNSTAQSQEVIRKQRPQRTGAWTKVRMGKSENKRNCYRSRPSGTGHMRLLVSGGAFGDIERLSGKCSIVDVLTENKNWLYSIFILALSHNQINAPFKGLIPGPLTDTKDTSSFVSVLTCTMSR